MSIKHAAAGIAAIVGLGAFLQQPQQPVDLTARVAALEKRVGTLEQFHAAPAGAPAVETKPAVGEFIVPVTVTNKRYQPADIMNGVVQDAVWWDSTYDFSKLEKPARAIKGELEFRDLFDAPKFAHVVTRDGIRTRFENDADDADDDEIVEDDGPRMHLQGDAIPSPEGNRGWRPSARFDLRFRRLQ